MGLILKEDNSNGEPEDLAAMIDRLFQQGGGHLVIDMDELGENVRFTTADSSDCGLGACAQPTEFIDDDAENDLPSDYYDDDDYDEEYVDDDDYDYEEEED